MNGLREDEETMKLVSVVIPMYNAEKTIKQCLNSLLKQTYLNFEIIVIDDGSQDKSPKICDDFSKKDSRMIVVHQPNKGSVEARRQGVMRCEGEYICFCDADDTMPPNAISLMVENMESADLCIGSGVRLINRFELKPRNPSPCFRIASPHRYTWGEFRDKLYCSWFGISNVPVVLWAKLYRTDILKQVYQQTPSVVQFYGDDLIVTLGYLPECREIVIIPDVVYHYRIGGGTSKYNPKMMDDWLALYRYKKPFTEKYAMPQDTEKLMDIELCNMAYTYLTMLGRSGKFSHEEILTRIKEVVRIPEVNMALENPKTDGTKFLAIQKMKERDWDGLLDMILSDAKQYNKKQWIRKIINFFS